ncbi:hypothetical protein L914_19766 [Phytophthora nicotianae]|uniref:DDE Tnp4 domain-containing protein n=1 Tax=Phytophthora nicotianae TaxID=4792 RepID=W2MBC0_PHYNI|nr:hypothetical protein L914_19766 [Phytophthora nicotianae]
MERVNLWLPECVVLHNMLIAFGDEWTEEYQNDSDSDSDDNEDQSELANDDDEFVFRQGLKQRAISKACEPGGKLWLGGRS